LSEEAPSVVFVLSLISGDIFRYLTELLRFINAQAEGFSYNKASGGNFGMGFIAYVKRELS
jgi:hypothetical protein